jgi:ribosomal protein S8
MRDYKKQGKVLKSLGLIDYDLRKQFTPAQKRVITRFSNVDNQNNKYRNLIRRPDNFVKRKPVSNIYKILKAEGYITHNKDIYLPKNGYDTVRIGKYKIGGRSFNSIIREIKVKKKNFKIKRQVDIITPRDQLLETFQFFSSITLPKGVSLTAKSESQSPFSASRLGYPTLADLITYLTQSWGGRTSREALASISLVIIVT